MINHKRTKDSYICTHIPMSPSWSSSTSLVVASASFLKVWGSKFGGKLLRNNNHTGQMWVTKQYHNCEALNRWANGKLWLPRVLYWEQALPKEVCLSTHNRLSLGPTQRCHTSRRIIRWSIGPSCDKRTTSKTNLCKGCPVSISRVTLSMAFETDSARNFW